MEEAKPKLYATDDLTSQEAELIRKAELDVEDYTVLRLPPIQGMQMAGMPDGGNILMQPFLLAPGTAVWQRKSLLFDPNGNAAVQLEPGDILAVEMRLVVRKAILCETAEQSEEA